MMGRGEREHTREGNDPMIRYGSVHEAQAQPRADQPLLPRPRASADAGAQVKT